MKKNIILSVILSALIITTASCSKSKPVEKSQTTTTQNEVTDKDQSSTQSRSIPGNKTKKKSSKGTFTFIEYLVGSDLEPEHKAATSILQNMMKVGSDKNLNIVVQTGGCPKWNIADISNKTTQRWLVQKGKLKLVKDMGVQEDMGKSSTLGDYIKWAVKTYPADKYALVMFDHGGGSVFGYGFDKISNKHLSLIDIEKTLKESQAVMDDKFEFIGFDSCLMGTIEAASILAPYANYMAASEEISYTHLWDYNKMMTAISDNPSITGDELGGVIIDAYKENAENFKVDKKVTLSVIDLGKLKDLVSALTPLIKNLNTDVGVETRFKIIASARGKSEDYGNTTDYSTDMVDLVSFADHIQKTYPAQAKSIKEKIKQVVVHRYNGEGKPEANGLTIYFPFRDKARFNQNLITYEALNFSSDYKNFVRNYVAVASGKKPMKKGLINFVNKLPVAKGKSYDIYINPEDVKNIDKLYSVIVYRSPQNPADILTLGMDSDVVVNPKNGRLYDNFNGKWLKLGDAFVSLFLERESDKGANYYTPILLNGVKHDLLIYRSFQTGDYQILGALKAVDPKINMPDRNIMKIKPEDKITPIYFFRNEKNGKTGYKNADKVVMGKNAILKESKLEKGNYFYGFQITDNLQNKHYSNYITIAVK